MALSVAQNGNVVCGNAAQPRTVPVCAGWPGSCAILAEIGSVRMQAFCTFLRVAAPPSNRTDGEHSSRLLFVNRKLRYRTLSQKIGREGECALFWRYPDSFERGNIIRQCNNHVSTRDWPRS